MAQAPNRHRVAAILLDDDGRLIMFQRIRKGREVYYVAPGGGVEPSDGSPEAALRRELCEELGAKVDIVSLAFEQSREVPAVGFQFETYYYCLVHKIQPSKVHASEFGDPEKGKFVQIRTEPTLEALHSLNILPPELKSFLLANISQLANLQKSRCTGAGGVCQ